MKKIKKTLPLVLTALFGIATLSGCSSQGSNATWYNPLTWDWSWANPVTWFQKDTDIDEEPAEDENNPAPQAKHMGIEIKAAFGQTGKKVLTVTISPANADVDLSFAANKAEIVVTKTADKTADVYVTNYFAGYGEITVSDAVSGIQATGKVYSYGKTILVTKTSLAHGKNGAFVVSDNATPGTTTGVVAIEKDLTFATQSATAFNEFGAYNPIGWVQPKSTIYIHVAYNGSFAPGVVNMSDANKIYTKVDDVAADPGQKTAVITVQLIDGLNNIHIRGASGNGEVLAAFFVQKAQAVQNITVPDITFNE